MDKMAEMQKRQQDSKFVFAQAEGDDQVVAVSVSVPTIRCQMRQNGTNSDRMSKILGWKTICLIPEIFVQ